MEATIKILYRLKKEDNKKYITLIVIYARIMILMACTYQNIQNYI